MQGHVQGHMQGHIQRHIQQHIQGIYKVYRSTNRTSCTMQYNMQFEIESSRPSALMPPPHSRLHNPAPSSSGPLLRSPHPSSPLQTHYPDSQPQYSRLSPLQIRAHLWLLRSEYFPLFSRLARPPRVVLVEMPRLGLFLQEYCLGSWWAIGMGEGREGNTLELALVFGVRFAVCVYGLVSRRTCWLWLRYIE